MSNQALAVIRGDAETPDTHDVTAAGIVAAGETTIELRRHNTLTSVPGEPGEAADSTFGALVTKRVIDPEGFFRTSQLTDQLRDTVALLVSRTTPPAAVTEMARSYGVLRQRLATQLVPELAQETLTVTPDIAADPSAEMILFGAAQLARWIDAIQAGPSFLLSQQVQQANAGELIKKVNEAIAATAKPVPVMGASSRVTSTYL